MKTQIIPLESHDDVISIRDKMSWVKTPRILLVWPHSARVDVRPLDLALLRRHAVSLGAELGLVTRDPEIRAAARHMDLPVFSKPAHAERRAWPMRVTVHPGRRAPRLDLRAERDALPGPELFTGFMQSAVVRLAFFSTGVLAMLLMPFFLLPTAEIHVTAPTRPQSVEITISAEPDATQVLLTGVIPSRLLTYNFELSDSIPASGKTTAPDKNAQGNVRFTNLAAAAVQVPEGTVVVTLSNPPVRFVTIEVAQVPLGNGSTADARVRALEPGLVGNVPAGAVVAFEGPLGLSLGVTNLTQMRGGSDRETPAPTAADRQALHDRLLAEIQSQANGELAGHLQPGDVVFPLTFGFSKILDETYTPSEGQAAELLKLTMRAEFHAHYAAAADLEQIARDVLNTSLPAGYEPIDGTLSVRAVSPFFGNTEGLTRWQVRASRMLRARINQAQVVSLAQGQTPEQASMLLQQTLGLEAAPEISVQPFFWPWLPSLPFQIKVTG